MSGLKHFLARLRSLGRRAGLDRDLQEQIDSHLEEAVEEWQRQGLSPADARRAALLAAARRHRDQALPRVTGEHYEGGHWLGSFATYLVTGRGLPAGAR